jgi:tRNA G46 methylase TrmB
MVQPPFVRQCARILRDGARLSLATDHDDYARQMEAVVGDDPSFVLVSRLIGEAAPEGVTNWEKKFRAQGKTIFKFEYVRRPRGTQEPEWMI